MTPEDFHFVEDVFQDALDAPSEERDAMIDARCAEKPLLAAEVRRLLGRHSPTGHALDTPVINVGTGLPAAIGPFEIIRLLGEGGMGTVFEAQQRSPTRRVALKVIRAGSWSRSTMRRFEHEIETLAQLEHPGIARLYESGTLPDGARYFAMELIAGAPLTAHAAQLSMEHKLELIARICDAVQHAHQRGIIHRDLKPGNVLVAVAAGDPVGQPKVMDFGIARSVEDNVSATLATRTGEFVGTLGYMSPEQLSGKRSAVDTRSDVFSLGVMAYELIAGRPPIDLANRPITEAIALMQESRVTPLTRHAPTAAGDIETIVAKALAPERERRYASASEFGADLRRYLKHEPILARNAGTWYHARKFAQRHRALVAAGAIVVVALAAGLAIATAMYLKADAARKGEALQKQAAQQNFAEATTQRQRADDQAQLNGAVRDYLVRDVLLAASPNRKGYGAKIVDVLDDAAAGAARRFPDRPDLHAEMLRTLLYVNAELGRNQIAADQGLAALELLEKQNRGSSEEAIEVAGETATALNHLEKLEQAAALAKKYLERARVSVSLRSDARHVLTHACAEALQKSGALTEARTLLEEHLKATEQFTEPADLAVRAGGLSILSATLRSMGDTRGSVYAAREAFALREKSAPPNSMGSITARSNLVNGLMSIGDVKAAVELAEPLLGLVDSTFPPDHIARVYSALSVGNAFKAAHRTAEARAAFEKGYQDACRIMDPFRWETERCVASMRDLGKSGVIPADEVLIWAQRGLEIRLVAANIGEADTVTKCAEEVAAETGTTPKAFLNEYFAALPARLQPASGRMSRIEANLARAAIVLGDLPLAQRSLSAARQHLDVAREKAADAAIIEACAAELARQASDSPK